ncbi:MAG: 5'/3'-nucleotidase SurE [Kiloniellales bacterium]|nr:5'/3'-nucleotidase SurE [Kiloniellales bacterium]
MSHAPLSLDCARVLLVNDDGIGSAGLALLERAVRGFTDDVWTVAPRDNQSARGRAYTLRRPVDCRHLNERRFAVTGTPVDCVLAALNGLIPGHRPDLVLSGVNQGTNLGEDIPASGTVGACLEAAEQGVPGIAFSQVGAYPEPDDSVWAPAERYLPELLPKLAAVLDHHELVLNVNFPRLRADGTIAGICVVPAGRRRGPVRIADRKDDGNGTSTFIYDDLRADHPMAPDCDIDRAYAGHITITPLKLDPTHEVRLPRLQTHFET